MAFPLPHLQRRAPRIQLGDAIAATVFKQDGRRTRGKLSAVSATGGLLRLRRALSQGDFVEVSFQMQSGTVQGLAEMLRPVIGATTVDGIRQAFRFVAMNDGDHRALQSASQFSIGLPAASPRKSL